MSLPPIDKIADEAIPLIPKKGVTHDLIVPLSADASLLGSQTTVFVPHPPSNQIYSKPIYTLQLHPFELVKQALNTDGDSPTPSTAIPALDVRSPHSQIYARIKLDDVFLPSDSIETRWVKYIPIKIYVFAWRVRLDRLPTRINLIRRGVVLESPLCPMCGLIPEDIHHVIFRCDIAQAVFRRICRWWDLDWHDLFSFSDCSLWANVLRGGLSNEKNWVGNVYVQFTEEEYAAKALKKLTRRYYAGRMILNHKLHDKKPSSDCERENDNKPSLDYERENVSFDKRRLSDGDVFDKLQVDEDLEWDEIGDIGENDEKHVTKGGSLKKDEVSKRLNSWGG
ncbi:RNA-directed DNA polymerase, eukaryota [Tanacetum coccineum]